jgi:hypothetical protein
MLLKSWRNVRACLRHGGWESQWEWNVWVVFVLAQQCWVLVYKYLVVDEADIVGALRDCLTLLVRGN